MKTVARSLQLLAVLLCIAAAFIAKADVSSGTPLYNWQQPATWSDGTPLSSSQITGYQLSCTGAATVTRRVATAAGVPPFQTPSSERYAPGSYTCTVAVFARQTATSSEVLGAASNPVSFTVPQPRPAAATSFSVE